MTRPRLTLLDLPLDPVTLDQALERLSVWVQPGQRSAHTVVTLNPEFIMQARAEDAQTAMTQAATNQAAAPSAFTQAMQQADLVTADGVGIVWAARKLLGQEVPRAPGFDLTSGLMAKHGSALRVFFLGSKPGVAEAAAAAAVSRYGIQVAGVHHGYFDTSEDQRVAELIRASGADLLLTGMGAGRQETFNEYWRGVLGVPVMIGCGGVLDVLAGSAQLAPVWTRKLGVEWIWRVVGDRKRWGRAPRLARFVLLVNRQAKATGHRAKP
ncbi:WecB/TagA/CpsF family glycosyltransferase [Deinococcus detaillensis]|uniref:WecB/TagA/CpsF family glycosyltransferase n=1 Tax=Deinococcus detaillensis TaxID=2592048 RepID=A0A553V4G5_9DEIO|nr:WecB/TagA/CpsF family glycosyltransferase [Deinococcus detaillensis]TSA87332.1 WecB/TagA/CpsF family glycosyltransferase [Deinococcus detaillensis]